MGGVERTSHTSVHFPGYGHSPYPTNLVKNATIIWIEPALIEK